MTAEEDLVLKQLGYAQQLDRSVSPFASFCVGFAVISATTAVYAGFGFGLSTAGPAFVWTVPVVVVIFAIWAMIAADLAVKLPLAGYAYQWTSRLVHPSLGWFTGYLGLIGFISGFTGVAYTFSTYFAGLIGWNATTPELVGTTAIVLLVCVLINVYGIRLATAINNLGVILEIFLTVGVTAFVLIFVVLIRHAGQPLSYLASHGDTATSPYMFAWMVASLGALFGLLGVEAPADIAEETRAARRVIPRTMFMALGTAAVIEFFMYVTFLLATGDRKAVNGSATPIEEIIASQISPHFADFVVAIALTNILVCVLANMLVATRLLYAMSRDNMTPLARVFNTVSAKHRVPTSAVWGSAAVSAFFLVTALFSEAAFAYILGMATIGYVGVYILTTAGMLVADARGTFPKSEPGFFDLGRFRRPIHILGLASFTIVLAALVLLPDFRPNLLPLAVLLVLGFGWWMFVLRRRIATGDAGPRRSTITDRAVVTADATPGDQTKNAG
ncbi:APC family permease [Mycolicibacterium brisbanense]|uniref:Amino acid transporter n=1 Tax=Mycolicibacterium brisbanense TaxID=146020 RepID=A0A100W1Y6_9MYCO|nr:amino acid permease [Mycolicibacterium brisbanense]MCV7157508.1 amino acid permease [Mycolicibacterium brisbanense]GAS90147.1 amino acid transporter [Mycolicibacterium brisbanense]